MLKIIENIGYKKLKWTKLYKHSRRLSNSKFPKAQGNLLLTIEIIK